MSEFKSLITLTQVSDGAPGEPGAPGRDGSGYYIETNQEEVLIFKTSQGNQISPAVLKIKMYKLPLTSNSELIDFSENYSFGYIDSTGIFKNLITTDYAGYYSFGNYEEDETSNVFSYSI
jgi:hypothetical protein